MKISKDKKSSTIHQVVVFGASGDLAKRKIYPALHSMHYRKILPENTYITGYGRTQMSTDTFSQHISQNIEYDKSFIDICSYRQGGYEWNDGFSELVNTLEYKKDYDICNRLFYVSLPPSVYSDIISNLPAMFSQDGWNRVIIEKPFGKDLQSFYTLRDVITKSISKDSIYCIDHYLAKATILKLIEQIPNIVPNEIRITWYEKKGTEGRPYFAEYGIIRDIIQNHILQIVSVLTVDTWTTEEKVRILRSINTVDPNTVTIGQYVGYDDSETFAKMPLCINNKKWKDVPVHVSVGKGMNCDKVEIQLGQDVYFIEKQNETKSYEILIEDALKGDKSKFVSFEEIEESWRILDDVLKHTYTPFKYQFGSEL